MCPNKYNRKSHLMLSVKDVARAAEATSPTLERGQLVEMFESTSAFCPPGREGFFFFLFRAGFLKKHPQILIFVL